MKVKLEAKPNRDFDRCTIQGSLKIKAQWVEVKSFKEASNTCVDFCDKNELGGGNWTGGDIKDDKGKLIAYVSYNGRVWESRQYPSMEINIK